MLLCLTANHLNSSFEFLEQLSTHEADVPTGLVGDTHFVNGAVVVATCNRFEAYLDIDEPLNVSAEVAAGMALEALAALSGIPVETVSSSVRVLSGSEVPPHLFAVSSGLHSVIIGEDEISGQVRRALEKARAAGTTSPDLERLFQMASQTSREVKSSTAIGGAGRSLVRLALELASSRIVEWATVRVLIVGTGQYAGTTVAALKSRGAENLHVYSPSGRAAPFALRHSLALSEDLAEGVALAEVVITCTASATHVIAPHHVATPVVDVVPAARSRLIIDLGMPRNVDPGVAGVDGIELLDLETIKLHAPLEELNATVEARVVVESAAKEFVARAAERTLSAGIVAMRSHVFELLDAEIERVRARSGGASTTEIEAALRHLVGVLLHTPSLRARELAREGEQEQFLGAIDALFGIRVPPGVKNIGAAEPPAAESA